MGYEVSRIKSFRREGEEFDKLVDEIIPKFLKFLRDTGTLDAGNYYYVDRYRKQIILFFPLKKNLVYPVVIDVTERTWYTPPSKFYNSKNESGIFYSMVRGFFRVVRRRGFKIKERMIRDRTFIALIKNATRSVKGVIRKTYSGISIGVLVVKKYKDILDALKTAFNFVFNYISRRYNKLRESLEAKGVEAFGEVKTLLINLDLIKTWIALTWIDWRRTHS